MLNCKPSFCFIAPTSYLNFTTASNTHLVLAHLIDRDEQYALFYRGLSAMGHYIMMDNSAYELKEPYSPDKLIELGQMCGAHAIVLPDYPFKDSSYTIDAAKKFIPDFKAAGFQTFFVPQSEKGDLQDWLDCYYWAAGNKDIDIIGMSILGIPNAIPYIDPAYARVVMSAMLIDRGAFAKDKHHHYLGLNSGPKLEIPSLVRMGTLNTIDSSGPIWAGILGHRYTKEADSLQMVSKLKLPVDFNIPRTKDKDTLERIQWNIDATVELMNPDNYGDAVWYAEE